MAKRVNPTHRDVEFALDHPTRGEEIYKYFPDAAAYVLQLAASTGRPVNLDVLVYSRSGALWWAGDSGLENYEEDPEASIFERLEVRVDPQGRIP